jgi:hypothetical protein
MAWHDPDHPVDPALLGALPSWGYSRSWGYFPSAAWASCWWW